MEEIVFLALRAMCALEASNQQNSYPQRDQHGEYASIHRNPMSQGLHFRSPFRVMIPPSERIWDLQECYPRFN
jgi:hypothetical protein